MVACVTARDLVQGSPMANALEFLEEAMAVPRAERCFMAERFLDSLDSDTSLSAEWGEQIGRRIARRESGESRVYSREEIRRDTQSLLAR